VCFFWPEVELQAEQRQAAKSKGCMCCGVRIEQPKRFVLIELFGGDFDRCCLAATRLVSLCTGRVVVSSWVMGHIYKGSF